MIDSPDNIRPRQSHVCLSSVATNYDDQFCNHGMSCGNGIGRL
jgi:hypothetical protein